MSRTFIVDTNILVIAQDLNHENFHSAVRLIFTLYDKCNKIGYNDKIMEEYRKHIHAPFIQKWFTDNFRMNKFKYIHCSNIEKPLLKKLKIDPDDIKFIEVAKSCPDKIIITEDSDFNVDVKSVLRDINIEIWNIREALEKIEI
jgi:predicted nucleic acid-binding protein